MNRHELSDNAFLVTVVIGGSAWYYRQCAVEVMADKGLVHIYVAGQHLATAPLSATHIQWEEESRPDWQTT